MILLLRRYEGNITPLHFPAIPVVDGEDEETKTEDWARSLLFNGFSVDATRAVATQYQELDESDRSDSYLIQAHSLVSAFNRERTDLGING